MDISAETDFKILLYLCVLYSPNGKKRGYTHVWYPEEEEMCLYCKKFISTKKSTVDQRVHCSSIHHIINKFMVDSEYVWSRFDDIAGRRLKNYISTLKDLIPLNQAPRYINHHLHVVREAAKKVLEG